MLIAKINSKDINKLRKADLNYFPHERNLVNPCFEKDLNQCPNFETALELETKMLKQNEKNQQFKKLCKEFILYKLFFKRFRQELTKNNFKIIMIREENFKK